MGLRCCIRRAAVAIILALLAMPPAVAQTNCANTALATLTSSTTVNAASAYDPFSGAGVTTNMTVTVRNGNAGNCSIAVVFVRPTSPIVMTNASFTLTYGVDFNGTNAINIGSPSSGWFATLAGGASFTFSTYHMTIAANQTSAAAGNYNDNMVQLYLYAFRFGTWQFVRTYGFNFNASIAKKCTMAAPSPSSLNFTPAISHGKPNAAYTLSSTLGSVRCTYPSKVTLSGTAMQHTPAIGAMPGFDNFINWRAVATLGGANATLDTSAASTVTSTSYNVGSGTTINGSVGVNVNLLAGQPLRSGNYTGTLTVTVDPTL